MTEQNFVCPVCGSQHESAQSRGTHFGRSHSEAEKRQVLIEKLRQLHREGDVSEIDTQPWGSKTTIKNIFGSWRQGLESARIDTTQKNQLSTEALLEELRNVADRVDRSPRKRDMEEYGAYGTSVYLRRFGSWNASLKKIGKTPNKRQSIPKQELLRDLEQVAAELGTTPTRDEYRKYGQFSAGTYHTKFGSWNAALEAIDETPTKHTNISREQLIGELKRLHDELGRAPTIDDVANDTSFGSATFERTFGSWNAALRAAGIDLNNRIDIGRNELVSELHRLEATLGQPPTASENREHGIFSLNPYQRVFGTWNAALKAAGMEPNHRLAIPRDELLTELQKLAEELDRVPTTIDMKVDGPFSQVPYQTTFGSWRDALEAAGFTDREIQRQSLHPIYGVGWTEAVRTQIRNRDNRQCTVCACTEQQHLEQYGTRLHVHHLCGARESTNPAVFNAKRNLLTVCFHCHSDLEKHTPGLPADVDHPFQSD